MVAKEVANNNKLIQNTKDRTILIWSAHQLEDAKDRKWFRLNIQYDFATKLAWSPDSKALAILKYTENCIEVYKLDRKDGWFSGYERGLSFPKTTDDDIIGFGIACTGRYIMTCNDKTDLYIWSLKGNILEKIDTYLMNTYSAKISPCGRFVAACGFAPDCKIWEVKFSRNGEYQKTVRAFDLSGHTSGIYDCAFDQDSSHIVTVSKDSSWKLYDIKIEFDKGQLPRCIKTGKYTIGMTDPIAALSLNAEVLAIATGNYVQLFSMFTGECDATIKKVYDVSPIIKIMFDPLGKYLLTAGDKHIRVYHNITGFKTSNMVAEEKLKNGGVTRSTTERLQQQIKDNENFIKKFN